MTETGDDCGLPEQVRAELRAYLAELGADEEQIARADTERGLGPLAVELAVGGGRGVPFFECAEAAGTDPVEAAVFWRALGFPDPAVAEPLLQADEERGLSMLRDVGTQLLGRDATLTLARLIGATTSRLADALVDAFRMQVEVPEMSAGMPYPQVVRTYSELLKVTLPELQAVIGACLRRHLVAAAAAAWSADEDSATPRRDLVVGFADLVGWTSLSRSLSPARLAQLVQRFERQVADVAAPYGVRVVKLLGDGAMVVCEDADKACAFGADLAAAVDADPELPPVRVGLAAGQVMVLGGDHHGQVVNLAARLSAAAVPGGVLVDDVVRARAGATRFGKPTPAELRGFAAPVSAAPVLAAVSGRA